MKRRIKMSADISSSVFNDEIHTHTHEKKKKKRKIRKEILSWFLLA